MAPKFSKVTPEDLEQLDLLTLAAEGKVFVVVDQPAQATDNEILAYVSRINDCVYPEYADIIGPLWEYIIGSPEFKLRYRKGARTGHICVPKIIAIAEVLACKDVYSTNAWQLFMRLENTDEKTTLYTSMSKDSFRVKDKQRKLIYKFLEENSK